MILSPIRKVLSSIARYEVRALLMGGQACILYGGAEFSRDIDFAILASKENIAQLRSSLDELEAEVIAVPPFSIDYLERGHAIHFRCAAPEAAGLRVDIMTKLRGVDDFEELWQRRHAIVSDDGTVFHLLSLPDLVKAKKTHRDKDWPMIRRLLEADYFANRDHATGEQLEFWMLELRTPELLIEVATANSELADSLEAFRPLLRFASKADEMALADALFQEEKIEREADREYWQPLKAELEQLRLDRLRP
ncbi:MAG: hypothetical protein IPM50_10965 [Acidobacteriota bacterium]|nr:MAG: hypothetical protein IPM50_10965 [Acidobacteriota bacterium]